MDIFSGSSPAEVAGIQSFVSAFNNFSAKPEFSSANGAGAVFPVRLVEFRPAWALHALLRFHGITYLNENLPIPVSMGQTLPLVVDGQHVMGEIDALAHYGQGDEQMQGESKEVSDIKAKISALGKMLRHIKYRNGREDMAEIKRACGSYCPTSWEAQIRDVMERMFSRDSKEDEDFVALDRQAIIELLRAQLGDLEAALVKNGGYLFVGERPRKASGGGDGRRQPIPRTHAAEATLFGHICDLLCSSVSSEVDKVEYPQIMSFVIGIFEDYFEMTTVPPSIEMESSLQGNREGKRKKVIEWRRSSDLLLQNTFVSTLPADCVIPSLLTQKTKYTSLDERSERAWRRLMALTPMSDTSPENDTTANRWTQIRFSVDSLAARLLRKVWRSDKDGDKADADADADADAAAEVSARDREGVVTVYLGGAMFLTAVGISFVGYLAVAGGYSRGFTVPSRLGGR